MAIDGASGFFRLLNANGETVYSRNGQFIKSSDNYIVNAQGMRLTGYPITVNPVTGERTPNIGADPVPLQIPMGNIAPKATTGVGFTVNLDSRQVAPAVAKFDPSNPASFNRSSVATVYDSLGNAHELSQYYVKRPPIQITVTNTDTATGNTTTTTGVDVSQWEVFYTLDG